MIVTYKCVLWYIAPNVFRFYRINRRKKKAYFILVAIITAATVKFEQWIFAVHLHCTLISLTKFVAVVFELFFSLYFHVLFHMTNGSLTNSHQLLSHDVNLDFAVLIICQTSAIFPSKLEEKTTNRQLTKLTAFIPCRRWWRNFVNWQKLLHACFDMRMRIRTRFDTI